MHTRRQQAMLVKSWDRHSALSISAVFITPNPVRRSNDRQPIYGRPGRSVARLGSFCKLTPCQYRPLLFLSCHGHRVRFNFESVSGPRTRMALAIGYFGEAAAYPKLESDECSRQKLATLRDFSFA